jgi:hypothetical protein
MIVKLIGLSDNEQVIPSIKALRAACPGMLLKEAKEIFDNLRYDKKPASIDIQPEAKKELSRHFIIERRGVDLKLFAVEIDSSTAPQYLILASDEHKARQVAEKDCGGRPVLDVLEITGPFENGSILLRW